MHAILKPEVATTPTPREVSLHAVRHTLVFLGLSAAAGLILAIIWSPGFVDQTLGENGATTILGYSVTLTPITSALMGIGFAFVSGFTGTFTACNVAGLAAIAPLSADRRPSLGRALRSLGWVALGASVVAGLYGAIGALIGPSIPQLSSAVLGKFPVRLIQSMVVFGVIGVTLIVMALTATGLSMNPIARLTQRRPAIRLVLIGGLIGAFLIGRPFPLFIKMFTYAASTHNPAFGAVSFVLQSLGNIVVMALLFLVITLVAGGRLRQWLAARPDRLGRFNAIALMTAGVFLVAYWCIRLPAYFGIGWWPRMPWS